MATKKKTPAFTITLTQGDIVYKGSGATVLQALQFMPKPVKIFNKGTLTLTHGSKKAVHALTVPRVKRLFYPIAQQFLAKQLHFTLK